VAPGRHSLSHKKIGNAYNYLEMKFLILSLFSYIIPDFCLLNPDKYSRDFFQFAAQPGSYFRKNFIDTNAG